MIFKSLLLIFLSVGLIWARSSYDKITRGNFADNLGDVLVKASQNNPYPAFGNFLQTVAIPNSYLFGQMVMWGELLTAVSIISSCLYLLWKNSKQKIALLALKLGLMGGAFLNINFWLTFAHTNSAVDSLNLLMIIIQLVGIITL
ncbi:MAG: hypothetical protein HYV37_03465 [Candidatus Levyibacteriota bacterium]|nr:MAG: hypothetical protein HYV37_03465 [Candidatus Levybacteria bacterium]